MDAFARDLRDAWRGLRGQSSLTVAAVVMLSLGIAASSAIYTVLQAVVLKMPFDEPGRIVTILARDEKGQNLPITSAQFERWRRMGAVFEAMAAYTLVDPVLTGGDAAHRLQAEALTPAMFAVLGVQPALGRPFAAGERQVAVLSHAFWVSRFHSDPNILGRVLSLDGVPTTILGVMPAGFDGPRSRPGDLWLPLADPPAGGQGAPVNVSVVGRLQPRVSADAAGSRLQAVPWDDTGRTAWTPVVRTAFEDFLLVEAVSQVRILGWAVAVVMLMACVNVASLLLGRNVARRRELAVRVAIGARRADIIRQVAVESLLLAAGASAIGLLLASWAVSAIVPLIPGSFPRAAQMRVDLGVAGFAAVAAVLSGLLVAVWPAWAAGRQDLAQAIKAVERGSSAGARRARTALVVLEATLGMVMLVGAALMVASFVRLYPAEPGFRTEGRTKFSIRFAGPRYAAPQARVAAVEEIASRLRAIPGAVDVSSATSLPLTGTTWTAAVRVAGASEPGARGATVHLRAALPNYLSFMGMPVVAGRDLTSADTAGAEAIAVVNEAFVGRWLRDREPLAARIVVQETGAAVTRRIVGVVRDARIFGNDLRPRPEVFVPYAQAPLPLAAFVVLAGRAGEANLHQEIRRAVRAFDPALPVDRVESLTEVAERSVTQQRFFATLMGAFAVVAVALAFVGLHAVAAWSVTQRTREIGIRLALGASPRDVRRMVLRYGAGVGVAGAVAGAACAFASASLVESYLSGFPARHPLMFVLPGVAFVAIVTLASYGPARRAMRVDPMRALRAD